MKSYYFLSYFLFCCFFVSNAQAPIANFTSSTQQVCLGESVTFTDQSTVGGSPISGYTWDFGDGNSSTQQNPSHVYVNPGTYTITLVTSAQNGQSDAEVKLNYITVNPLPQVSFTPSGNGCTVPFSVTFNNTSVSGAGISNNWDFGNGLSSTQQTPSAVSYTTAGTYTVELEVVDASTGCSNSITQDIVVSDYSANADIPTEGCVGESILFSDLSTVGTNTWSWNFGDGQTATQQNPSIAYGSPGTYTVTLTSQNSTSGCSDVFTQDITIHDLPAPDFTADIQTGCAPLQVNFTNNSNGGVTYAWDFGNGITSTNQNPSTITYTADGSYTVSLTMTDANGCSNTFAQNGYINVSAPNVQFTMDQYNGCAPLDVQFSESSTSPDPTGDPIVTWLWDFGNGSGIFSGQNPPVQTYNEGEYDVTLTVVTQNGCQSTLIYTDTIQVGDISNANFSVNPPIECAKTNIDFIDETVFNGSPDPSDVTYSWDFGDGGLSTEQSPTYSYPSDTGYFDVTLIVDWRGCKDTIIMNQAVYIKAPISLFTLDQTLFCNPTSLPITLNVQDDAILGVVPDDVDMTWNWGDGSSTFFDDADLDDADQGSTSHNYTAYGSYTVEQVIYNHTTGCSDSTQQTIHVSQTDASFILSNDSTCVGSPITLTSTSTSSHPFGSFTYTMGDGGSTSGNPATYTYNTSGAYDIELTATNSVGCSDIAIFTGLDALALPIASITPSATTGCAPINAVYTNNSSTTGNGLPMESFNWTFPDNSTQTTTSVSTNTNYNYTTVGTFSTSLTVTDEFGCVSPPSTVNMTITKPSADFTVPTVVCDLEQFSAVNSTTGATSYEWFVDGNIEATAVDYTDFFDEVQSSTSNSVNHTITLIATDLNGCKDTTEQSITVSMPIASFDVTLSGASVNQLGEFTCPPVFANFEDNSNSVGNITSWNWNFGDGKTSTLQDPNNTYVFAGTYSAGVTITDEFGCTSDTMLIDYLTIFGPSGDVSWSSVGDICGQTYVFNSDNLENVVNIEWDLDDGEIVNDTNQFNHTYESYLTFNPTATLTDDLGCEVIYELDPIVIISNGLDASFSPSPPKGPMGTTFVFQDQSTSTSTPISTWTWVVDGDTITNFTGTDISQGFGLPGDYEVTLIVVDANGCIDKYTTQVTITDEFTLPNVITTNNDGVNDFMTLPAAIFTSYDFVVINRWGNVISEQNDANGILLWDGKNKNGNDVTDGVYFYKLKGELVNGDTVMKHGNVTVVSGQ